MNLKQLLEKNGACRKGCVWALSNCQTLEDVWATARPDWLIWVATRTGVLTDKELRLFACWSVRQVWHTLTDDRSKTAVEVAERYANGEATKDELTAAAAAADDAARAATAADDADDAYYAARAAQAKYLRENCKPDFINL